MEAVVSPLFFVRNPYAAWLRDGSKTVEIRKGTRYRNVAAGGTISINGSFRLRVLRVESYDSIDVLVGSVDPIACGLADSDALRAALTGLYPEARGPWYAFHLEPIAP
jgi:ASC-1-like (ASCH) protein